MIKYISLFLAIFFTILIMANPSFAATDRQPKTIKGKVRNQDGSVAKNLDVKITCGTNVMTTTTNSFGNYQVIYATDACVQFDTVTVEAPGAGTAAAVSKTVTFALTQEFTDLTLLATGATTSIPTPTIPSPSTPPSIEEQPVAAPEYTGVFAIMTAVLSFTSYLFFQKKSWAYLQNFSTNSPRERKRSARG